MHMNHTPLLPDPIPHEALTVDAPTESPRLHRRANGRARILILKEKLFPLRLILWTVGCMVAGAGLAYAFLPVLSAEGISQLLEVHLPSEGTSSTTVFLRLCLFCFPCGLILSAAGLTGFCQTVTGLTLGIRGLSDGAVLYLLWLAYQGGIALPAERRALPLLLSFGLWVLLRLLSRVGLALSSHSTAAHYFDPEARLKDGQRGLSPLLLRHLLCTLIFFLLGVLACIAYTLLLYS